MTPSRRAFLAGTVAAVAGAVIAPRLFAGEAPRAVKIRIGSCGVNLEKAKLAGLEGVEAQCGGAAEKLAIADEKTRQGYKDKMKETGLVVASLMGSVFNSNPLATDPHGVSWLEQSIDGAQDLGAKVILVAFFGKGSLGNAKSGIKTADIDAVVEKLKVVAERAQKAGVKLGIENTIPAEENMKILDRVGSPAVGVYYDVYNLTQQGYDAPKEIKMLGDRICQFHFKNGPDYLESGKVKWEPVAEAIKGIGYQGWIVLETSSPSKDAVADARKNAEYIRKLFRLS